jgi:outer membrane scaffolding protein for murein synthesis (MipA/OmpV family)
MQRRTALLPLLMFPLAATAGPAATDVLVDFLAIPGSAGLGAIQRLDRPPYKDANTSEDLVPLYMYEGKRVYLHASRVGLKLGDAKDHGLELFLDYRYEGYPIQTPPKVLDGMARRTAAVQSGAAYRGRTGFGNVDLEVLHDANSTSHGTEWRFIYSIDIHQGRWHFRPAWTLAHRSANLNNYYYGVPAAEAIPGRPAYMPGAGNDLTAALYGYYELTRRWRLLGGIGVTYPDAAVRNSPLVADKSARWSARPMTSAATKPMARRGGRSTPASSAAARPSATSCPPWRCAAARPAPATTPASGAWTSARRWSNASTAGRSISPLMPACWRTTNAGCARPARNSTSRSRRVITDFPGASVF